MWVALCAFFVNCIVPLSRLVCFTCHVRTPLCIHAQPWRCSGPQVASIMGDEARAKANAAYQANGQTM